MLVKTRLFIIHALFFRECAGCFNFTWTLGFGAEERVAWSGVADAHLDTARPMNSVKQRWSKQVQTVIERDPELIKWAKQYVLSPDKLEIEARLIVIQPTSTLSCIPVELFTQILERVHRGHSNSKAFVATTAASSSSTPSPPPPPLKWQYHEDRINSRHCRHRFSKVTDAKGRTKENHAYTFKDKIAQRDFRIEGRPLGIRLTLKAEVPLVAPSNGQGRGTKAKRNGEQNNNDDDCSLLRLVNRTSFRLDGSTATTSLEMDDDLGDLKSNKTAEDATWWLQTDFSQIWQATGGSAEVARSAAPIYEVEIELNNQMALQRVWQRADDVNAAIEDMKELIGTLLLSAMELQELSDDTYLIPLKS